ncbi:MAG: hypothetical protein JSV88_11290, partial [Candidatus Aminicenantes bacterium]
RFDSSNPVEMRMNRPGQGLINQAPTNLCRGRSLCLPQKHLAWPIYHNLALTINKEEIDEGKFFKRKK